MHAYDFVEAFVAENGQVLNSLACCVRACAFLVSLANCHSCGTWLVGCTDSYGTSLVSLTDLDTTTLLLGLT